MGRMYALINQYRMMNLNIVESINEKLVEACELPNLDFQEKTRIHFESRNCKNRERSSYTKITLRKRFKSTLQLSIRLGMRFKSILQLNILKSSRLAVSNFIYIFLAYCNID